MRMNAGRLSRRITIQQRSTSQDALGQPVESWSDLATVWADIRSTNGLSFIKESVQADANTSMVRQSFRIRYRTGIDAAMRVSYNGDLYNIIAVMPDLGDKIHVDLVCELIK